MFLLAVESVKVPLAVIVPTIGLIGTGFYGTIRYLLQFNQYLQSEIKRRDETADRKDSENREVLIKANESMTRMGFVAEQLIALMRQK